LSYSEQIGSEGYVVIPELIEQAVISDVCDLVREQACTSAGTRRFLDLPWCAALADRIVRDERVQEVLPQDAVAVQCTLFTKTPETNWLVPLHQDLAIPVAERVDSELCSGWSEKEGELHVQPPVQVLQQVLAIRLHLEACNERNGALRVIPGSHRRGRLNSIQEQQERDRRESVYVNVPRGGAMLMRPLLLHASGKVRVDSPRRVLHFVFGPRHLPERLRWSSLK
jgi:ectoine hydroxylase-related dioxygenase (phytanoyl-CoA dioxygenase family)